MNYSHLIHERSLTTTPHRQKPIIEPPEYPVVFLTQKNKSNRVQLVFFVVEMQDLPYSDCYRRSIASSRRGSHGNAVLRFFKIAINPRFDDIKKQVEQGSTCLLCGGDAGICSKRSLRNSKRANLFAKRSVSPKYGVHVAEQRHDEIVQNPRIKSIKKQVEQGSTCFLSGGSAGI